MKPPFEWDAYSDQPKIITDRIFKRRARFGAIDDYLKMLGLAGIVLPLAGLKYAFVRPNPQPGLDLFGIGLSLDKGPSQLDLADELGVNHILIRIPLWDLRRLDDYVVFAKSIRQRGKSVLFNVLQDREHIEDQRLLELDLNRVFDLLGQVSHEFQIGNAINRIKWGFFSIAEYLNFFKTAQTIRDNKFPTVELLGPSVIDFEYFYTIRALFGREDIMFDRLSSLLYVDRAGSPKAKQLGLFNLAAKIRLLATIQSMCKKVKHEGLYITEVNWPITGRAPYAPTSEKECVSIDQYCQYMRDYFQITAKSGFVSRVYWHQLVAPGYGLVDDRTGSLRKTPAFYAFKEMVAQYRLTDKKATGAT